MINSPALYDMINSPALYDMINSPALYDMINSPALYDMINSPALYDMINSPALYDMINSPALYDMRIILFQTSEQEDLESYREQIRQHSVTICQMEEKVNKAQKKAKILQQDNTALKQKLQVKPNVYIFNICLSFFICILISVSGLQKFTY